MRAVKAWSEPECQLLIDDYGVIESDKLAKKLDCSVQALRQKAKRIGISKNEKNLEVEYDYAIWSQPELDLLEAWAETKPILELALDWNKRAQWKGWPKRSPGALRHKINRLGMSQSPQVGYYRLPALAAGLNTTHAVLRGWVTSKKLKATRNEGSDNTWNVVSEQDFVNFALTYPREVAERISPEGMCWLLQMIKNCRNKQLGG